MSLIRSLDAVRRASGDGLVDWDAAAAAARESTDPGDLGRGRAEDEAYRDAFREARDGIGAVVGTTVTLPDRVELFDRHHWIDHTAASFDRIVAAAMTTPGRSHAARSVNTGTAAFTLGYLARRVVGQYDPALFAPPDERAMFIVDPNLRRTAAELSVSVDPFRRWVVHHEVSHAAEFDLAPWLVDHLEARIERALGDLARGRLDREALRELTDVMTVIEGFAELLMDEAMADDVGYLRDRLERRRSGMGPLSQLIEWFLGITAKRRQYDRGRRFFEAVASARGVGATVAVWEGPHTLPSHDELATPRDWLDRVDP